MVTQEKLEDWIGYPSEYFRKPSEVLSVKGLKKSERIEILKNWANEERNKITASGEGMELNRVKENLEEANECLEHLLHH